MLTTNQVLFIAQVSIIPYSMGYESCHNLIFEQNIKIKKKKEEEV